MARRYLFLVGATSLGDDVDLPRDVALQLGDRGDEIIVLCAAATVAAFRRPRLRLGHVDLAAPQLERAVADVVVTRGCDAAVVAEVEIERVRSLRALIPCPLFAFDPWDRGDAPSGVVRLLPVPPGRPDGEPGRYNALPPLGDPWAIRARWRGEAGLGAADAVLLVDTAASPPAHAQRLVDALAGVAGARIAHVGDAPLPRAGARLGDKYRFFGPPALADLPSILSSADVAVTVDVGGPVVRGAVAVGCPAVVCGAGDASARPALVDNPFTSTFLAVPPPDGGDGTLAETCRELCADGAALRHRQARYRELIASLPSGAEVVGATSAPRRRAPPASPPRAAISEPEPPALIEGQVRFRGCRLWYAVAGADQPGTPLVCIPGGPGFAHDYLLPVAALVSTGRPVVFYDGVGAGRSESPADVDWTLDLLVDEIAALCAALPWPRVHLFAHSAGGYPTLEYAVARPPELAGLVLCSTPADVPDYLAGVRRLVARLPDAERQAIEQQERNPTGAYTSAYARAFYGFVHRYVCRLVTPLPPGIIAAERKKNRALHARLRGRPGQLYYDGTLADWSIMDRLADIAVPTLFTCGGHDSLHLGQCEAIARTIPDCRLEVFEDSAHMQFMEEPDRYFALVASFLAEVDGGRRGGQL